MSKIELIAIDLDGTLVPDGSDRVSIENIKAIEAAQKHGINVTIATGRIYSHAKIITDDLSLNNIPVITLNGADIRLNGVTLYKNPLPFETVEKIMRITNNFPNAVKMIFTSECVYAAYTDNNKALTDSFSKKILGNITPLHKVENIELAYPNIRDNTSKILFVANNCEEFSLLMRNLQKITDVCELTNSGGYNIEINKKGVSKDKGVNFIATYLGVKSESVMTIGDSGNDAAMLKSSAIGIAVANASAEALKVADFVTDSCKENGVAKAIYNFALNN